METKNNINTKLICTEKDVLIALSKLEDEYRILLDTQKIEDLIKLVNDKDCRNATIENLDWCIKTYPKYKAAICRMCALAINEKTQKTADKKMVDMIENYKGFSREERLEFYKRLVKEKTPENYTDETKYMCSNFGNVLQSALESALKS